MNPTILEAIQMNQIPMEV